MKSNAIVRIILWSLVIVILLGILFAGLGFTIFRRDTTLAATMVPLDEASVPQNYNGTATAVVNVRKTPSSSSEVVGMLDQGEAVEVLRTESVNGQEWGYLPAYEGWVVMEYIDLDAPVPSGSNDVIANNSPAQATETLNIRNNPSPTGKVVGQLEKGETVEILRFEEIDGVEWGYITSPVSGWIALDHVSMDNAYSTPDYSPQDYSSMFSTKAVDRISINWVSGKITVEPADVSDITILEETPDSKYPTVIKNKNGKLTIDFAESTTFNGLGLNFHTATLRKDLTIQVPRDFSLKELELDAASTDLEIHDLTVGEVELDTASGATTFLNCTVEELDVDSASGDVIFKGSLRKLDFDAASASFRGVFTNIPQQLKMDSMSGELDITLPPEAGFTVKQDGMSNDFSSEFDTVNRNGSYIHGDGACRIEVDGMSNDITIRMGVAATPTPQEVPAVPEATTTPDAPTEPEAPTAPEAATAPGATHHTEPGTHHPENGQHF